MAFNTTADYIQTAGNVIDEALEILGVLEEGETASTAQIDSGIRSLNNIIKNWSADTQIFAQNEYILDLVPGTGIYQLGVSNVGFIPNKIQNAVLINTSTDDEIPIRSLTQEEYYALTQKTIEARPTQWYQKRNPVGVDMDLYLWPVPNDTTFDLKLWVQFPLRDTDVIGDDLYFTQEWFLPLAFELAYVLSYKYGWASQDRDDLRFSSDMYKDIADSYDTDGSVYLQPMNKNG